jgi:hypothetical protein
MASSSGPQPHNLAQEGSTAKTALTIRLEHSFSAFEHKSMQSKLVPLQFYFTGAYAA